MVEHNKELVPATIQQQLSLREQLELLEQLVENDDQGSIQVLEMAIQKKVDGCAWIMKEWELEIEMFKQLAAYYKDKATRKESLLERLKNIIKFNILRFSKDKEIRGTTERFYIKETKSVNDNALLKIPIEYKTVTVKFDGPVWKSIQGLVSEQLGGIPYLKLTEEIKKNEFKDYLKTAVVQDEDYLLTKVHLGVGAARRKK